MCVCAPSDREQRYAGHNSLSARDHRRNCIHHGLQTMSRILASRSSRHPPPPPPSPQILKCVEAECHPSLQATGTMMHTDVARCLHSLLLTSAGPRHAYMNPDSCAELLCCAEQPGCVLHRSSATSSTIDTSSTRESLGYKFSLTAHEGGGVR